MAQTQSTAHLLVIGYIRSYEKRNKLSKIISNDIKHLIYAFYPKTYQLMADNYEKIALLENLKTLRLAYDNCTKSIYLSGKKFADQHNFHQIYNQQCEWINFKNNPPYFWQIQCLLNLEDTDHCIAIVKDVNGNFCYFLFNKHTLEWNKNVNEKLISLDEDCISARIENCIFVKEFNVMLLCVSKDIVNKQMDSTEYFELSVFDMHNIQKPKFLKCGVFRLDYRWYDVIEHPLYFNKIILFGGKSVKNGHETKSFLDTFMVIEIDKETLEICEDIDYDFEQQFGGDSFAECLKESESVDANPWNMGTDFDMENAEYFNFNHCVIGHQLFVFGGYCRRKVQESLMVYDFFENKWSLSNVKFPKEISKARMVWNENTNKLHLFAMDAWLAFQKKDYKWHYVFDLKELC